MTKPRKAFATGDLSAVMPGQSPCGRTNMRIRGWMGRSDQTTKIKGMFVRPEQIVQLVATRDGEKDLITVQIETESKDAKAFERSVAELLKLKGRIELLAPGTLPNDGKVIDDQRVYD